MNCLSQNELDLLKRINELTRNLEQTLHKNNRDATYPIQIIRQQILVRINKESKAMKENTVEYLGKRVEELEKQLEERDEPKSEAKMEHATLFIWTEFCPDYFGGLAFAVAENENQARELIIKEYGYSPSNWGKLEKWTLGYPVAKAIGGGS